MRFRFRCGNEPVAALIRPHEVLDAQANLCWQNGSEKGEKQPLLKKRGELFWQEFLPAIVAHVFQVKASLFGVFCPGPFELVQFVSGIDETGDLKSRRVRCAPVDMLHRRDALRTLL